MGGKVAMQLALRHPELLRALVVVDVAPSDYPERGARTDDPDEEATPFAGYIAAMRAMDLDSLQTRDDADAALRPAVPSRMVRSFLLQSLVRDGAGDGWRWRLNLDALGPRPRAPARLPRAAAGRHVRRAGALDRRGELDLRAARRTGARMDELFPSTRLVKIKNAGHWVHSEQPEVFLETLRRFLDVVEQG